MLILEGKFMENAKIKLLYEIIEHSSMLNNMLVSAEIAMNDGNLLDTQKFTKNAQNFLKTMTQDTLKEFFQVFEIENKETNSFEIPSNLEISKSISSLNYNISVLLGLILENQNGLIDNCLNKIAKDINTIVSLYNCLYAN